MCDYIGLDVSLKETTISVRRGVANSSRMAVSSSLMMLITRSREVASRAARYDRQLEGCRI